MTRTRIHDLSMSLDGFATGEGQALDAPFGHAGHRLHEWMFATRFGAPILGRTGGTVGVDDAFAQQHEPGIGDEIMGAGEFGPWAGRPTPAGQGGGARTRPIVLDRGVRLWDGLDALEEDYDVEAVPTPSGITHLTFPPVVTARIRSACPAASVA